MTTSTRTTRLTPDQLSTLAWEEYVLTVGAYDTCKPAYYDHDHDAVPYDPRSPAYNPEVLGAPYPPPYDPFPFEN
jgi:hypothetical protein